MHRVRDTHAQGDTSSNTRPLVSTANAAVTIAAKPAIAAKVRNTGCKPPAIMAPTMFGPIIEANRSQAVAVPTPTTTLRPRRRLRHHPLEQLPQLVRHQPLNDPHHDSQNTESPK